MNVLFMIHCPQQSGEMPVVFCRTSAGADLIVDWLRSLPPEDRRVIGTDLATLQFGWPIGMPICRPLGQGLWEVRSTLPSRRIARLLFFVHEGRIAAHYGVGVLPASPHKPRDKAEVEAGVGFAQTYILGRLGRLTFF